MMEFTVTGLERKKQIPTKPDCGKITLKGYEAPPEAPIQDVIYVSEITLYVPLAEMAMFPFGKRFQLVEGQ
jgi:hypothetical protein